MDLNRRRSRFRKRVKYITKRPRLSIFRSNKYIYVSLIDMHTGNVLASLSTKKLAKTNKDLEGKKPVEIAYILGQTFGKELKKKGFEKIVFDRSGYKYHGKVKAIAEGLRKAGLIF